MLKAIHASEDLAAAREKANRVIEKLRGLRLSRAAEKRYELATPHSITSSARASSVGGMSRPSALAVVRSMTRSNFVEARRMLCAIPADLPPAWFPAPSALHRFEPCMP